MALARVMLLEHVGLFDDLPRIGEEFVSLVGERDAAVGAREDPNAKLALELLDRNREIRLRCVHALCRSAHGPGLGDEIAKLLERHIYPSIAYITWQSILSIARYGNYAWSKFYANVRKSGEIADVYPRARPIPHERSSAWQRRTFHMTRSTTTKRSRPCRASSSRNCSSATSRTSSSSPTRIVPTTNAPGMRRASRRKSIASLTYGSSPSSTSRRSVIRKASAASLASCAAFPKTRSSTWPPPRVRPACPR